MTEREVELAALAAVLAAVASVAVPGFLLLVGWILVAMVAVGRSFVALAGGRVASPGPVPRLLFATVLVVTVSGRAAASEPAFAHPPSRVDSWITVVTDPELSHHRWSFEARLGTDRVVAEAAEDLESVGSLSVGRRVRVQGSGAVLSGRWTWRASHHLGWRLRLTRVEHVVPGDWPWATAEAFRTALSTATRGWGDDERALFAGVAVGDDRGQSVLVQHRFRVAGLSHLLAVSGQNVAFVLVAASPLLRRVSIRTRWLLAVPLLGWFALVTRLEPSVLRAVVMATVAVVAAATGRVASGRRTLSVAAVLLLLVDPMLVWSVGFQLSVAASWAVLAWSRPIARHLHGPRWCREVAAVTLAATLGTVPLLLSIGAAVPVAGVLANMVAVPVAGWLMIWAMTVMPAAGALGFDGASIAAWPAHLATRWLAFVARLGADPRVPLLDTRRVAVVAVGLAAAWGVTRRVRAREQRVRIGVATGLLGLVAALVFVHPPPGATTLRDGTTVAIGHGGEVVLSIGGRVDVELVLRHLAGRAVTHVDVLAVARDTSAVATAVFTLRQALRVRSVVGPTGLTIADMRAFTEEDLRVGTVVLRLGHDPPAWQLVGTDRFRGQPARR